MICSTKTFMGKTEIACTLGAWTCTGMLWPLVGTVSERLT